MPNPGLTNEEIEETIRIYIANNCNVTASAEAAGIPRTSFSTRLRAARRRGFDVPCAAMWSVCRRTIKADGSVISETQKPTPMLEPIEIPGATVKFETTWYDSQGRPDRQVVRRQPEAAAREALWRSLAEDLVRPLPRLDAVPAPVGVAEELCAEIPVGDHHFGMLSWDKETGADYDLGIAEGLLINAACHLLGLVPKCARGVIEILGDYQHYDSFKPVTPTHLNILDSDTRYPKMAAVAQRVLRVLVDVALTRCQEVLLIVVGGNHDPVGAVWLRLSLSAIYEKEPRVTVEMSPRDFQYWEFGKNLVGVYHGHQVKMAQLPLLMATDQPAAWGRAEYRYWRTGHIHHSKTQAQVSSGDFSRCSVESFRVLAPEDSWAHQKGYRSLRDMKVILLHKEFGERARYTVNPLMLAHSIDVR